MKTMRGVTRVARAIGAMAATLLILAAAAAATLVSPSRAEAQETETTCRCVDADGREIKDCTCFRRPGGPDALAFSLFRRPRAQIGVSVGAGSGDGEDRAGVRILSVRPDSPADEAGLREGDRVVRVDGRSVLEPLEGDEDEQPWTSFAGWSAVRRFTRLVGDLEPGEPVELEYVREGETHRTTITPEEPDELVRLNAVMEPTRFRSLEAEPRVWSFGGDGEGPVRVLTRTLDPCFSGDRSGGLVAVGGARCVDGIRLQPLNPQLAEYFGVETGVLVVEVLEDAALGLRAGDVIVAIGERTIEDDADVRRILGSYEMDEPITVTVVRKGERVQVRGTRGAS